MSMVNVLFDTSPKTFVVSNSVCDTHLSRKVILISFLLDTADFIVICSAYLQMWNVSLIFDANQNTLSYLHIFSQLLNLMIIAIYLYI